LKKLPISCMLCNCDKDDPKKLNLALSHVWFCRQIIFLADNSTQESLALAEKYGCEIHKWTGENSMSARRNYVMKQMKHEYILQCDSDEIYDWDAYYKIRDFISVPHEEYIFAIRLVNITTNGDVQSVTPLERMFKKEVTWEKEIQNQLKAPTKQAAMIAGRYGDLVNLYHDGYGDAREHAYKQWKRIPANERMVRESPDDGHTRMFLINALVVAGAGQPLAMEQIQAHTDIYIEQFKVSQKEKLDCKILQKVLRFYFCATSERGQWGNCLDLLNEYIGYVDFHIDALYWMHTCNYELRNLKDAIVWGEKFVKRLENPEALKNNIEITTMGLGRDVIERIICCLEHMDETKWTKKQLKRWKKKL